MPSSPSEFHVDTREMSNTWIELEQDEDISENLGEHLGQKQQGETFKGK